MSAQQLPLGTVTKIVKRALPSDLNLSKQSAGEFSKAASIFILYLTSTAMERAQANKRSTLLPSDVMDAMQQIGFSDMVPELQEHLENFTNKNKKRKLDGEVKSEKVEEKEDVKMEEVKGEENIVEKTEETSDDVVMAENSALEESEIVTQETITDATLE